VGQIGWREYSKVVGVPKTGREYDSKAPPAAGKVVEKGTRRRQWQVLHLYQPADAVTDRIIGQPMTNNIRIVKRGILIPKLGCLGITQIRVG
jgi:hypothetical protein